MIHRALRIVVFAPHFAEYATRLAVALSRTAQVLLVTEARNRDAECEGLAIGTDAPALQQVSYAADLALRGISLRGALTRRRIRQAILAFGPDIIHIQEQGDPFTAAIACDLARVCPIVLTVHDPVPHSGNDALVAQRFADGLTRLRGAASAFHVHGAHCEALLRQALRTAKPIAATAHGVILVPPEPAIENDGDRYLFFGRMEAYKGLDVLLDAIDLLPIDGTARFVLAGRGPELDRHRSRISASSRIEVVDRFLPPLEAIGAFQSASAVLVPYRDATQSGVIAAAFGNGRPVIATRVGGLSDAVDHGGSGILIPPGDPAALAAAILSLAGARTRRRLTEGARRSAGGRFSWDTVAAQLRVLYDEIVSPGPSLQDET